MAADVRLYRDNEGETYLGHSLDEILAHMRDDLGVDQIDPPEDWEESDWERCREPIRDDCGGPDTLLCDLVREHIENGGPVPIQIATTYV